MFTNHNETLDRAVEKFDRRSRARGALALLRVLRHHQATHLDAAQRAAAEELLQALLQSLQGLQQFLLVSLRTSLKTALRFEVRLEDGDGSVQVVSDGFAVGPQGL